jgi:hypothetical protein
MESVWWIFIAIGVFFSVAILSFFTPAGVSVPISIFVTAILTYLATTTFNPPAKATGVGAASSLSGHVGDFFKNLVLYMPNSIILFGFIVDTINQDFRYSVASLVGIASILVNYAVGASIDLVSGKEPVAEEIGEIPGATSTLSPGEQLPSWIPQLPTLGTPRDAPRGNRGPYAPDVPLGPNGRPTIHRPGQHHGNRDHRNRDRDRGQRGGADFKGCFVPGFEFLESRYLPQGIVLPSAVFMYILSDFVAAKRPADRNIGLSVLPVVIVLFQAFVLWGQGCLKEYYFSKRFPGGGGAILTVALAWALGMLAGYVSYTIVNATAPQTLPSRAPEHFETGKTTITPGVSSTAAKKDRAGGKDVVEKSFPPNDEDQFVCDAYRNGELVTSTIVG